MASCFPGCFVDRIFKNICLLSGGRRSRLLLDVLEKSYPELYVVGLG